MEIKLKRGYSINVKSDPLLATDKIVYLGSYSPSGYMATMIVGQGGVSPTIRENHGEVVAIMNGYEIRKLTPRECWRLQGQSIYAQGLWYDANYEKAARVNKDTYLYKQAGNSITVDVLCHIFRSMEKQNILPRM